VSLESRLKKEGRYPLSQICLVSVSRVLPERFLTVSCSWGRFEKVIESLLEKLAERFLSAS